MIESLLPASVVAVEAFGDRPAEPSFPDEADLIARAVEGRRNEFLTGRRCAHEALTLLGFPPAPLLSGPRREPLWPAGAVGSITHCNGYRAAAVCRIPGRAHPRTSSPSPAATAPSGATPRATTPSAKVSIGIDAEPHSPLPAGVLDRIVGDGDHERLAGLDRSHPGLNWGKILFSAKESIYKAWFPLTGRWLGFEDAALTIDPVSGAFTGRILIDSPPELSELRGRFLVGHGLVLTAVTVGL